VKDETEVVAKLAKKSSKQHFLTEDNL